jgi:hypothetical protein
MAAPVLPRNSLPTTAPITTPISEGMVVSDLPQNPGKRECHGVLADFGPGPGGKARTLMFTGRERETLSYWEGE